MGADGVRHRRVLSTDKQVAERMLAKLVRERDLVEGGLVIEEGQERLLVEIKDKYLADLASYSAAHARVGDLYRDPEAWTRKAVLNIAASGGFSSDRTLADYARESWRVEGCPNA